MKKAWLVAKYEYLSNVRRRSFLFGAIAVPVISALVFAIIIAVTVGAVGNLESLGNVGYVDAAGVLAEGRDLPTTFQPFADEAAARAALDSATIGAYFAIPADYLQSGEIDIVSDGGTPSDLQDQITAAIAANLGASLDPARLERLIAPVNSSLLTLDNGRLVPGDGIAGLFIAPLLFLMVFVFATQATSGYLMSTVVEEKSSRVIEILVTAITPFQLLFGKILGLGAVGLTQVAIWIAVAGLGLRLGQGIPFIQSIYVPPDLLILGIIYFLLSYFMLACLMAGVGAITGSDQESRQFAGILSFVFSIPYFFVIVFLTDPESPIVTFLSIFPITSPSGALMRIGFASMPPEHILLSLALLLITALVIAWVSARIFRWSLLMYGKRPGLREILRGLRGGGVNTSGQNEGERRAA